MKRWNRKTKKAKKAKTDGCSSCHSLFVATPTATLFAQPPSLVLLVFDPFSSKQSREAGSLQAHRLFFAWRRVLFFFLICLCVVVWFRFCKCVCVQLLFSFSSSLAFCWWWSAAKMASVSKKLVCIGDGSAGKTCLLIVYANDEFPEVSMCVCVCGCVGCTCVYVCVCGCVG